MVEFYTQLQINVRSSTKFILRDLMHKLACGILYKIGWWDLIQNLHILFIGCGHQSLPGSGIFTVLYKIGLWDLLQNLHYGILCTNWLVGSYTKLGGGILYKICIYFS